MPDLEDGETAEVQGSGSNRYTLKNIGGVYSCSCQAWQYQSLPIDLRTCKHLKAFRGEQAEIARVGDAASTPRRRAAPPSGSGGTASAGVTVAPGLLLAHSWDRVTDPASWWMSEKLDGVRAFWDGEQFISRQGNRFFAPDWFIADLPEDPLDGELWIGRKKFQQTVSVVRRQDRSDHWREVRYLVFDAPEVDEPFEDRLEHVKQLFAAQQPPYAHVVAHERCRDAEHLRAELDRIESLGGEGLMLRKPGSRYQKGRSSTLLKVKSFHDAEARVVAHLPGAGKHSGRLGALQSELPDGTLFSIGTGFSDDEREDPPPVGTLVTFRYQELTDGGVPRFPSFVGIRHDLSWEQVSWPPPGREIAQATAEDAPVADLAGVEPAQPPEPVEEVSRQLQFQGAKTVKFWEVEQQGKQLRVTSGRVGHDPKVVTHTFKNPRQAAEHANKLADAKLEKGYEEF